MYSKSPTLKGRASSLTGDLCNIRVKARVNWLLRQLAKTQEDGIHVKAVYGRGNRYRSFLYIDEISIIHNKRASK